jgi:hypothetical protein
MNFITETLTVVVGIVVADTLMDKQRRDDVVKATRYMRDDLTIRMAQWRAAAMRAAR